jgi:hypothetical protein
MAFQSAGDGVRVLRRSCKMLVPPLRQPIPWAASKTTTITSLLATGRRADTQSGETEPQGPKKPLLKF